MAATIKDVAQRAGVAISTVSKVMNSSSKIALSTRKRVEAAMEELNYIPNRLARSFVQQSAQAIGVLMELGRSYAFSNPYNYEILGGIEQTSHERGFILTVSNIDVLKSNKKALDQLVQEKRIDGIIVHASAATQDILHYLDREQFPYVTIGAPDFPCQGSAVDIDNIQAGIMATDHILNQGYQRPAFIGGPPRDNITNRRFEGFKLSLERHGIPIHDPWVYRSTVDTDQGKAGLHTVWSAFEDQKPDSLICVSNFLAMGALQQAQAEGLAVPQDLGIICFDTYPFAPYSNPPLTAVDIDLYELGRHAADALFYAIEHPGTSVTYKMIQPQVVPRRSTEKSG
ncbi:LacI family DNA-binding transcriptional regulator [Spirochaeta lutea]|uniref:HTH lacI-type domain-containing protein n=1 Tax=Spirochaeta lutea TaxID=1480694 RepID=A0A098QZT6_9SPIO|nr:LacI family DNA-binding transcriptional regulator [Spirochaeta lutea]KGE73370.1 hypothetical protein DC28_04455 [Spirochaeta lutea]